MLSASARVGLQVELEGREQLYSAIGEITDRLANMLSTAGGSQWNPLATPPSAGMPGGQPQPSGYPGAAGFPVFGTYNTDTKHTIPLAYDPAQATFFNPNTGSQYQGAQWPGTGGGGGPTTIQNVQNMVFQNVQVVNITGGIASATFQGGGPGGGGGAPGGGGGWGAFAAWNADAKRAVPLAYDPGEGQFFNLETGMGMAGVGWPGGGGRASGQTTGGVRGGGGGLLGALGISGLLGNLLGGLGVYQLIHAGTGMAGTSMEYAMSGGDTSQLQYSAQMWNRIPILSSLMSPLVQPILERNIEMERYQTTAAFMGVTPGGVDRYTSPSYLRMVSTMAAQGIEDPDWVRQAMGGQHIEQVPLTPAYPGAPTFGTRSELVFDVPAYVREQIMGAYGNIRTSEYGMAGYGYGEGPSLAEATRLAIGMGDYPNAITLGRLGGQDPRGSIAEVLRSRYEIRTLGEELGRESAESRRMGALLGRGGAAPFLGAMVNTTAQQQELLNVEFEMVREQFLAGGPTERFLLDRKMREIERQRAELEAIGVEYGIAAVEDEYGGMMESSEITSGRMRTWIRRAEIRGGGLGGRMARGVLGAGALAGRAATAEERVGALRSRRVGGVRLERAQLEAEQASMQAEEEGRALAQTPVDLWLQENLAQTQYTANVLSNVPGSYGNLRGALRTQMEGLEEAAAQVSRIRNWMARSGQLRPEWEHELRSREREIGLQQAAAFQQLSWGWESRLVGMTLGTPGNLNLEGRGISYMDAVLGGAWNPHFGATQEQLPFFLRYASNVPFPVIPGYRGFPFGGPGTFWSGQAGRSLGGQPFAGRYAGAPSGVPSGVPGAPGGPGGAAGAGVDLGAGGVPDEAVAGPGAASAGTAAGPLAGWHTDVMNVTAGVVNIYCRGHGGGSPGTPGAGVSESFGNQPGRGQGAEGMAGRSVMPPLPTAGGSLGGGPTADDFWAGFMGGWVRPYVDGFDASGVPIGGGWDALVGRPPEPWGFDFGDFGSTASTAPGPSPGTRPRGVGALTGDVDTLGIRTRAIPTADFERHLARSRTGIPTADAFFAGGHWRRGMDNVTTIRVVNDRGATIGQEAIANELGRGELMNVPGHQT